ncbi:HDL272Cp [Eremothecium sinecaudum]|uniref:HDL272Cp n=1 Tax=Eremothecium sinecaudum TaxID=45286 RepID=A0A0X8HS55_9SACH|nr:HDL272Cp [Eremothecium sinecaudum]AMD20472.1 HDL272Cp [Eremothecium sinecaudum]
MVFRLLSRTVLLPAAGLATGFMSSATMVPATAEQDQPVVRQIADERNAAKDVTGQKNAVGSLSQLKNTHDGEMLYEKMSRPVRENTVSQGILYGTDKLVMDPNIFLDSKQGKLTAYYHLGPGLANEKKKVHQGLLALILDEALCFCGFPSLPNGLGVTARLSITYLKDIPLDSTVVLKAQVVEAKGRKCIIQGVLESPSNPGVVYARARCLLVEPKWMKHARRIFT